MDRALSRPIRASYLLAGSLLLGMMFVPREAQAQTLSQGESTNLRSKAPGARAGAARRGKASGRWKLTQEQNDLHAPMRNSPAPNNRRLFDGRCSRPSFKCGGPAQPGPLLCLGQSCFRKSPLLYLKSSLWNVRTTWTRRSYSLKTA
jgi:hypothetical protein